MTQECLEKAGAKEGKIKRGVSEKHTCGKSGTDYRSSKKPKSDNSRRVGLHFYHAPLQYGKSVRLDHVLQTRRLAQQIKPRDQGIRALLAAIRVYPRS